MDFALCPSCKSRSWYDRIAVDEGLSGIRFKCSRCGKVIKLAGCSHCGARNWIRENDLFEKKSKMPIVRYRCGGCSRVVGIILDNEVF